MSPTADILFSVQNLHHYAAVACWLVQAMAHFVLPVSSNSTQSSKFHDHCSSTCSTGGVPTNSMTVSPIYAMPQVYLQRERVERGHRKLKQFKGEHKNTMILGIKRKLGRLTREYGSPVVVLNAGKSFCPILSAMSTNSPLYHNKAGSPFALSASAAKCAPNKPLIKIITL